MARKSHPHPTPLPEARRALLAAAPPLASRETLSVADALGRVTADAVVARASVPHYHGAAMDGIAVRARDTAGASDEQPVELELGTPDTAARPFSWVDTGNALPAWADAVVMIERVFAGRARAAVAAERALAGSAVRQVHLRAPASPWQHVRLVGEDVVATEPLLPRGHRIRPYDVGALLAAGVVEVALRPRPVVAILPTGDELIEPGEVRRPGRIVEFNSRMLAAFVEDWGGAPLRLAPVGDNLDAVRSRLAIALREADVVCVIAGSSAGAHDFTARALEAAGEILAHGIAIMPGKPAIVAAVAPADGARARVALGVPGYPVSAAVACRELLEPLLAHLLGAAMATRATARAMTPRALPSRLGQEEFVRVTLGEVDGRVVVSPLARGAGAITTMVRADGFVRVPPDVEAIASGTEVEVELLRPLAEALGTIVVTGSDDLALDALEDALKAAHPRYKLATTSVGSAAALRALERGEVHAAATHALGAATAASGVVVHLARREHGLIVAPGNPLRLTSFADLERGRVRAVPSVVRSGVRVVNRGPDPGGDQEQDEYTQMALAAAVHSGLADAARGTAAAAAALGLGFVALEREDYDLVLRADFASSEAGRALLEVVRGAPFRAALARLGGYDTTRTGDEKR